MIKITNFVLIGSENLETGDGKLPLNWDVVIGGKKIKLELRNFEDGKYQLFISGTNFDDLKGPNDTDSDDSHSDTEAEDRKMSLTEGKGHAKINKHVILENQDVKVISEKQFSQDIQAILGDMCVKAIELVHI